MPRQTEAPKVFACACGVSYAHQPNLCRHKKTCTYVEPAPRKEAQVTADAGLDELYKRLGELHIEIKQLELLIMLKTS